MNPISVVISGNTVLSEFKKADRDWQEMGIKMMFWAPVVLSAHQALLYGLCLSTTSVICTDGGAIGRPHCVEEETEAQGDEVVCSRKCRETAEWTLASSSAAPMPGS